MSQRNASDTNHINSNKLRGGVQNIEQNDKNGCTKRDYQPTVTNPSATPPISREYSLAITPCRHPLR